MVKRLNKAANDGERGFSQCCPCKDIYTGRGPSEAGLWHMLPKCQTCRAVTKRSPSAGQILVSPLKAVTIFILLSHAF